VNRDSPERRSDAPARDALQIRGVRQRAAVEMLLGMPNDGLRQRMLTELFSSNGDAEEVFL
jgi:hypothetical protein